MAEAGRIWSVGDRVDRVEALGPRDAFSLSRSLLLGLVRLRLELALGLGLGLGSGSGSGLESSFEPALAGAELF